MKTLLFLLGIFACSNEVLTSHSIGGAHFARDLYLRAKFNDFVHKYDKVYETSAHYEERLAIFSQNVEEIEKHNSQNHSWRKAINQFADLTEHEFKSTYASGYLNVVKREGAALESTKSIDIRDLPDSKDWRDDGIVTDPKDQGMCGSCWAFAAVEQLESYLAIETKELTSLSAQHITSCSPNPMHCGGTGGCGGSIPQLGFTYTHMMGVLTEEDYPYTSGHTGRTGDCKYEAESQTAGVYVRGYETLPHNDYNAVMNHIATVGPLAIAADASSWSFYGGGVFDGCSYHRNIELNHAIQLVGYGTDPNEGPYWLVRNSWGKGWGDHGYIKLKRELEAVCGTDTTPMMGTGCKGDGNTVQKVCGMCGVIFDTSYPIGADTVSHIKP